MSFFTDPTISTLTSGTPSQNVDLAGFSFPRRIGFRLHPNYIERYRLRGQQVIWECFEDENFTKSLGKDFTHQDLINFSGWCRGYYKGIFPKEEAYLKCMIKNIKTGQLIKTFYFKFTKSYQTSLDGRTYIKDPILDQKIIKNGVLQELIRVEKDDKVFYKEGHVTFPLETIGKIDAESNEDMLITKPHNAVIQHSVRYSEKPKMAFLITPPHLMKYAKLILILLKQLVDLNFDQSYSVSRFIVKSYGTGLSPGELMV